MVWTPLEKACKTINSTKWARCSYFPRLPRAQRYLIWSWDNLNPLQNLFKKWKLKILCNCTVTVRPEADWEDVARFLLISTRRPKGRSSYSPTRGWKDGLRCWFNMQRLSCCTFTEEKLVLFSQYKLHIPKMSLSIFTTSIFPRACFLLRAMWLICVLCNSRRYLAAVFHDVELAAAGRFAWLIFAALSPHLLSAI